MLYFILIIMMAYLIFSRPVMEGIKSKKRKKQEKVERKENKPPGSTPMATKVIMFARKIPFYNYLPSFIRALFEQFIKFIIFF